ncbi:cupin domain-containing protein [Tundrisphaera lichenicola]|uniref:cupin domain-containing protein n=1 Tax=Tundrisphaera lichenicola TaxID=2029860 RepID=UPI003EB6C5C9
MSDLSRRGFIGSAAFAAGLVGVEAGPEAEADEADFAFKNNVPDRLLAGRELPTFKFELEKSEGKVIGGSSGKEATVEQLPISKGIAGVSMKLEPGAIRELHWHATAAEWAFVIEGRVRTTVIDPLGNQETNDFGPGDVWYFPRGHGHSLQGMGPGTCHFILIFDNGYFSEFGTFSITDWLGHTPKPLLAKNLGVPESALAGLPEGEVYFARGPVPPESQQPPLYGTLRTPPETHKFELLKQEPHSVHKGGREWRLGSDRFPISTTITGVVLDLDPGGLRELHWHPNADEWQYVISGKVSVTLFGSHGRYRIETLEAGDVGYIPQGYGHSIENIGEGPARVLIGFNTGHYEAIDLSTWIAGNPAYLLAANLGLEKSAIEKLPTDRVFIAPKEGAEREPSGRDQFSGPPGR